MYLYLAYLYIRSLHIHAYIHRPIYIYIYILTYIHTYIGLYIYTYIHTYIHRPIYVHTYIHRPTYVQYAVDICLGEDFVVCIHSVIMIGYDIVHNI